MQRALAAVRSLDAALDRGRDYAPLLVRLLVGSRLVYGTVDNVVSYARMVEFAHFLAHHGFPLPLAGAFLSAYAQFLGGLLLIAGALVRPAAAVMVVNFVVALATVHVGQPYLDNFDAIAMLLGSAALVCSGAGRPSVDAWLARRAPAPPAS